MDKKDDKWTGIRPSKGSTSNNAPQVVSYVFDSKNEGGAPEMIRTSDLLLRRQAAVTWYL